MSAATVPIALVEALEEGRIKPGALLLLPAFGAGLTWCAHLVRWGDRVAPLSGSEAGLAPATQSALALVQTLIRQRAVTAS
jgi:3-oxoacyl-[acyl-carrier-protein] synthase-3